jgi:hypothetical protein
MFVHARQVFIWRQNPYRKNGQIVALIKRMWKKLWRFIRAAYKSAREKVFAIHIRDNA